LQEENAHKDLNSRNNEYKVEINNTEVKPGLGNAMRNNQVHKNEGTMDILRKEKPQYGIKTKSVG